MFVPATLLETSTGFGKAWLVDVLIAMDLKMSMFDVLSHKVVTAVEGICIA